MVIFGRKLPIGVVEPSPMSCNGITHATICVVEAWSDESICPVSKNHEKGKWFNTDVGDVVDTMAR
jgi:hypothetical protein